MLSMPKAWLQVQAKKATVSKEQNKPVVARIDMSAEVAGRGLCPECKKPMGTAICNGIKTYVCHADRISIPMANDDGC